MDKNNAIPPSNHRTDYICREDFFMGIACVSAMRSKDPCTQVGACIVDNMNKFVAVGYNGMPRGCNDEEFPWEKNTENPLDSKFLYVCHAELNAILNSNGYDLTNCTMYVKLFPCNECAKAIIQSGIKKVIYMSDKNSHKFETIASKRMLNAAKIEYRQFQPKSRRIIINFHDTDCNNEKELQALTLSEQDSPLQSQ